mmetsp:Transcript_13824/g.44458  ORF Transcript_13824/g.44458 Transcript_13824/m.44458 type:complete len:835 (-) Transcript_13824:40-2544(-)
MVNHARRPGRDVTRAALISLCTRGAAEYTTADRRKPSGERDRNFNVEPSPMPSSRDHRPPEEPQGSGEVRVAQERVRGGRAAAEELEDRRRGQRPTEPHDGLGVAAAERDDRALVLEAGLLEGGEAVGGEDLGPLVRVVARRVAAREDVRERAEEAVLGQRREDRRALANLLEAAEGVVLRGVEVGVVQRQVAHSKLELAQHHRGGAVVLGRPQLVHRRLVDGLAALPVLGHPAQGAELVRPILHELRRLLDRVPLDAADAADVPLVHLGEHVLQRVPALVEERLHLAESHQARRDAAVRLGDGRRLVADHVRDGQPHRAARRRKGAAARADLVHPRAAALLRRARERVEEDVGGGRAVALQLKQPHVLVPHLRADVCRAALDDGDAEEARDDAEEAVEDAVEREVLAERLLVVRELLLLELLGVVVDVPQRDAAAGEGLQLLVLLGGGRVRLRAQVLKQRVRLAQRRHLCGERDFGVRGPAEQRRLLLAQLQDAPDARPVVVAAKLGRARDVGAVQRLAQPAVVRKGHHGEEARAVQRRDPRARLRARLLPARGVLDVAAARARRHHRSRRRGQAGHRLGCRQHLCERLCPVQHRVRKRGGQRGELRLDLLEAGLLRAEQADAGQLAVENLELGHPPLRGREGSPRRLVVAQSAPPLVQRRAARQLGREGDHVRLDGVGGRAEIRGVLHHLEVADGAPRAGHKLTEPLDRIGQVGVRRRLSASERGLDVTLEIFKRRLRLCQACLHRGLHVLRPDVGEARKERGRVEQRVLGRLARCNRRRCGGGGGGEGQDGAWAANCRALQSEADLTTHGAEHGTHWAAPAPARRDSVSER